MQVSVCKETSVESTLDGIRKWIDVYGCFNILVTNQGKRFKNQAMGRWYGSFGVIHYCLIEYDHHSNFLVERCNTSIVKLLRKELCQNYGVSLDDAVVEVMKG